MTFNVKTVVFVALFGLLIWLSVVVPLLEPLSVQPALTKERSSGVITRVQKEESTVLIDGQTTYIQTKRTTSETSFLIHDRTKMKDDTESSPKVVWELLCELIELVANMLSLKMIFFPRKSPERNDYA